MSKEIISIVAIIVVSSTNYTFAQNDTSTAPTKELSSTESDNTFQPGLLPGAVSVVPGFVMHGAGHWAAGDSQTAKKLLTAEICGIGLMFGGIFAAAMTGASPFTTGAAVIASTVGFSLFLHSYTSDIYGSTGSIGGLAGDPEKLVLRTGFCYIDDPLFNNSYMITTALNMTFNRVFIKSSAASTFDSTNYLAGVLTAYRIWKSDSYQNVKEKTFVDIEGALSYKKYQSEKFSVITPELRFTGRYDLARFSPTLSGSFSEVSLGYGAAYHKYDISDTYDGDNIYDVLIVRSTYGIYLKKSNGEIRAFYDQRKDTYAGGMNSFMGYAGVAAEVFLHNSIGCFTEISYGSALVINTGLLYRY